jgi:hypothetical protein
MKKKINITLDRENGNVNIKIKCPRELEEFFKKISNNETIKSVYWKNENGEPQEFYAMNSDYSEMIQKTLDKIGGRSSFFDNYGNGLIGQGLYSSSSSYNIAPLRTKGIGSGYVCLRSERFESFSNLELEQYIRELSTAVKTIWETLINKTKIKAIITMEI